MLGLIKGISDVLGTGNLIDDVGTFWDTHIGREGFWGGLGDMTGLWESGTTRDARQGMITGLNRDIEALKANDKFTEKASWKNFDTSTGNTFKKGKGIIQSSNFSNLATDTNREKLRTDAIQNTINNVNADYNRTIIRHADRRQATDDRIFAKEQIKRQV